MSYQRQDKNDPATKGDIRDLKDHVTATYVRKLDYDNEMNYKLDANSVQGMINSTLGSKLAVAQSDAHKAAMKDKIKDLFRSILVPAFVAWVVSTDFQFSDLLDMF